MKKRLLITGGAGFIGSNLAHYFSGKNYKVTIFDNFMRFGTKDNCEWLKKENPEITIIEGDIRDAKATQKATSDKDIIFHLAAQVAVTTSVTDPRTDFELNALGTFNVLEGARKSGRKPIFIFSSTNKVYGGMEEVGIVERNGQYAYKDLPYGVSETMNLDFHSPYGCSKGAADQYVRDYSRIYDLPTVVFRQSCIYGPRQFGIEDQGWVAWFIIATTFGKKISIYGDGKQVRDVLYVNDLVRLFEIAVNKIKIARGKIYNVGGGKENILSVWHGFGPILTKLFKKDLRPEFADWRPGDQKVYVSDIRKVKRELGWEPKVRVEEGMEKLYHWVTINKQLFNQFFH
jgi:CDP-paratose 2-epimerase